MVDTLRFYFPMIFFCWQWACRVEIVLRYMCLKGLKSKIKVCTNDSSCLAGVFHHPRDQKSRWISRPVLVGSSGFLGRHGMCFGTIRFHFL